MEQLLAMGGFGSVLVQWTNAVLLLVLFAFAGRHSADRGVFSAWLGARGSLVFALSAVLGAFYIGPVAAPDHFVSDGLAVHLGGAAYGLGKALYWVLLLAGARRVAARAMASRPSWRRPVLWVAAAVVVAAVSAALPRLDQAMVVQCAIALPAMVSIWRALGGAHRCGRSPRPALLRVAVAVSLVTWSVYLVVFGADLLGSPLVESPLAAFGMPNAYVDALLDTAVTFGTLFWLLEDTHDAVQDRQRRRVERLTRLQEATSALVRLPEIGSGDVEGLARAACARLASTVGATRVALWLRDPGTNALVAAGRWEEGAGWVSGSASLPAAASDRCLAVLEAGPLLFHDDEELSSLAADTGAGVTRLDAPVREGRDVAGVLHAERPMARGEWLPEEGVFLGVVGGLIGRARVHARALEAERCRREAEARLRHAQKMEAVGRLAGGIAHDFNNLLCAILGYTSLALERASPGQRATLREIRSAAERAAGLVGKLLSFSRRRVVNPTLLDLDEVIGDLESLIRGLVSEDVVVEIALGGAGFVRADRGELEQVFLNLCANARDAMGGGGRLKVETRREEAGDPNAGWAVVEVSDEGPGVPDEVKERVFEPFFTTKPDGRGTGLGLAIVHSLVEQHDGEVRVLDRPGGGAVFQVRLPGSAAPAPEDSGRTTVEPA